jgi:DNA-binding CsgD family transcriptional regulator
LVLNPPPVHGRREENKESRALFILEAVNFMLQVNKLTKKELHLWMCICTGMSLKTYAKEFKLSYGYVKKKFYMTITKLGLTGRVWQQYVDYKINNISDRGILCLQIIK